MGNQLKVKSLKLAESIRVRQSDEDKFLDFTSVKYRDYECFYKSGLVYIINKLNGECHCTSMANIRQMVVFDHDLHDSGDPQRDHATNPSPASAEPEIAELPKAKRSYRRSSETKGV
jgi:hypothetical protein